ncbi:MAG: LacI family DNA-binding transcriptional regulator [Verrucomicrobiae bacterium]|nr:LacI family DNA-binding transcriptional regulator [Verrucomicrobiae bacterium]
MPSPNVRSTSQLAKHLGLSRWTISRALNKHPGVNAKTVERVQQAMRDLQFEPNPLARGLRGGRTGVIGICVQELENHNLTTKISCLQKQLRDRQYRGVIEFTMGQPKIEEEVLRHFMALRVEGVVMMAPVQPSLSRSFEQLRQHKIPVVAIDPADEAMPGAFAIDRRHAMELAIGHLHDLGHRQFALLGIGENVPFGKTRLAGLDASLKKRGVNPKTHLHSFSEPGPVLADYDYGWTLAERFQVNHCQATAIVALNDRIAFGAMRYFQQKGIELPRQLSIIGYDNMGFTGYCSPALTTLDAQVGELIDRATDQLFAQISKEAAPAKTPTLIQPALIQRQSTARAP